MSFGQFAATSQFYLYGRQFCTSVGYEKSMKQYFKATKKPDLLKDESLSLDEKVCMVTGANSGVGYEVAMYLASKGATVIMVCRSKGRADTAREKIVSDTGCTPEKVTVLVCDCSLESDVRRAWTEFCAMSPAQTSPPDDGSGGGGGGDTKTPRLDLLVCNAGVLLNEKTLTSEGVETTFACHFLFGTFLLTTLAMPSLEATSESRVVVVSSGGMYNTKWPEFSVAASRKPGAVYDGNMAYAYCKRGQVLLCERWAAEHPTIKFVTCHPGWTLTPAVDAAYGENKKYLEPLRTPWQGADGIAWLCVCPSSELQQGAFYLDRVPRTKHISGPFFTEGTFTKNTSAEVDEMMRCLVLWSSADTRPPLPPPEEEAADAAALGKSAVEMDTPIEIEKFMGRWFVIASQGTYFEQGMMNCIEDYTWNAKEERIEVVFSMQKDAASASTVVQQRAAITNKATNTKWAISPKLGGVFLPIGLTYLVAHCDLPNYETTIVTVPDRSYVWIMARTSTVEARTLDGLLDKAVRLGFDPAKIQVVKHDYTSGKQAASTSLEQKESSAGGANSPKSPQEIVRASEAAVAAEVAALASEHSVNDQGAAEK